MAFGGPRRSRGLKDHLPLRWRVGSSHPCFALHEECGQGSKMNDCVSALSALLCTALCCSRGPVEKGSPK
eukprot:scaffold178_cov255-Pinguiococcus_pyrenoidosus.AAC.19